ncbi:MAG: hypothetical protein EXR76_20320 [Myxococcales bacterium]|nr:hypothetical protein [Myxococcales bacterium]
MARSTAQLELEVLPQPDDSTCGPTCLHAVYRYWGDSIPLEQVIAEVTPLEEGGTLGVWLACHALQRGFDAEIYSYNLELFDPTWFSKSVDLAERLRAQKAFKPHGKLSLEADAFIELLELGGSVQMKDLTDDLIANLLECRIPVLTGLSATYLYGCPREHDQEPDDLRGLPTGHFVVLCGYDEARREVMVADPLQDNPGFASHYYRVGMDRLIASILLGIVTYDANLVVITPKGSNGPSADPG